MKLEDCAKLEEKYTRLAVEQANALHDPERKVQASLSIMAQLNDARVDLSYPPSALYRAARTALLGAAVTLATVTSFAVYESQHVHREDKRNMQEHSDAQQRGATEGIAIVKAKYIKLEKDYTALEKQLRELDELHQKTLVDYDKERTGFQEKTESLQSEKELWEHNFRVIYDEFCTYADSRIDVDNQNQNRIKSLQKELAQTNEEYKKVLIEMLVLGDSSWELLCGTKEARDMKTLQKVVDAYIEKIDPIVRSPREIVK